jgi:hypothetical protein
MGDKSLHIIQLFWMNNLEDIGIIYIYLNEVSISSCQPYENNVSLYLVRKV